MGTGASDQGDGIDPSPSVHPGRELKPRVEIAEIGFEGLLKVVGSGGTPSRLGMESGC